MSSDDFDRLVKETQARIDAQEESMYSKKVMREYRDPQNVGRMSKSDGFGEITGPCGDTMEFYLLVNDGYIEDINFWTDGCGPSIACGSITTKLAKSRTVADARSVTKQAVLEALDGLPEESLHCAKLAADTLRKALANYEERNR